MFGTHCLFLNIVVLLNAELTGNLISQFDRNVQVPSMLYKVSSNAKHCWAEAPIKIARMTLTIKLDGNWSSFQLANNTSPLSVTDSIIAPSARMFSRFTFPLTFAHCSCGVLVPVAALLARRGR